MKRNVRNRKGYSVDGDCKLVTEFIGSLPFSLTKGQENAVLEIIKDIKSPYRMNRLLQGDVGSEKDYRNFSSGCICGFNGSPSDINGSHRGFSHTTF